MSTINIFSGLKRCSVAAVLEATISIYNFYRSNFKPFSHHFILSTA